MTTPGSPENPHAGQGSAVVIDIGGDIGAVVVTVPPAMAGLEVDIVPEGVELGGGHDHPHDDDGHDDHGHDDHGHDDHGHGHGDGHHHHAHAHDAAGNHVHVEHVAVVDRPLPGGGTAPTLVYGAVAAGRYRLRVRPDGPEGPEVVVTGGEVSFLDWS